MKYFFDSSMMTDPLKIRLHWADNISSACRSEWHEDHVYGNKPTYMPDSSGRRSPYPTEVGKVTLPRLESEGLVGHPGDTLDMDTEIVCLIRSSITL